MRNLFRVVKENWLLSSAISLVVLYVILVYIVGESNIISGILKNIFNRVLEDFLNDLKQI